MNFQTITRFSGFLQDTTATTELAQSFQRFQQKFLPESSYAPVSEYVTYSPTGTKGDGTSARRVLISILAIRGLRHGNNFTALL